MARVAVEMGARRDVTITLTIKVDNATALAAVMKSIAAIAPRRGWASRLARCNLSVGEGSRLRRGSRGIA
jgi:hypothetical protein